MSGSSNPYAEEPLIYSVGLDGVGVRVNVAFYSIYYPAIQAEAGAIKIVSSTGATGVGVQLMDNAATPLASNQKFLVGSMPSNGTYTINWKAHYIQTASAETTENANTSVTEALSYDIWSKE